MALEYKRRRRVVRRVSSSHECIMEFDRQRRCRIGNGVSLFPGGEGWLDKGRSEAGSASGVRKDDVG